MWHTLYFYWTRCSKPFIVIAVDGVSYLQNVTFDSRRLSGRLLLETVYYATGFKDEYLRKCSYVYSFTERIFLNAKSKSNSAVFKINI